MSMIPVDLRLAKMMILGTIFKCLDTVLTIAALLSSKPLFTAPIDRRDDAKRAREAFTTARSDLLTDARAYHEVAALRGGAARSFCEKVSTSTAAYQEVPTKPRHHKHRPEVVEASGTALYPVRHPWWRS